MFNIRKSFSTKLTLGILMMAVVIFVLSLGVLFTQSRHLIRTKAVGRANNVLNATMQRITRHLMTIENATNSYSWMIEQSFQPESLLGYSNLIVRLNPHIDGCSISAEPDMFKKYGKHFSVYTVRELGDASGAAPGTVPDSITTVIEEEYDYFHKIWYKTPRELNAGCWVVYTDEADSLELTLDGMVASYGKPLYSADSSVVGIISTDLSLLRLSKVMSEVRPYPHSYFTMIDGDGRFIIHPDSTRLFTQTIFTNADPRGSFDRIALGHEMTAGKKGQMVVNIDGAPCLVCYQPVAGTKWSLAIVCPDSDVLAGYYRLTYIVVPLLVVGLIIILLLCHRVVAHTIRPLNQLLDKTQSIAAGNMEVHISKSRSEDVIGRLQNSFATMLRSLNFHMGSVRYTSEQTRLRNEELEKATLLAKEAESQKTIFIQNVTHQIRTPLNIIMGFAQVLRDTNADSLSDEEMKSIPDMMQHNAATLKRLVQMLFDSSDTGISEELNSHKHERVPCNQVARECIKYVQLRSPHINVHLETDVDDDFCIFTSSLYLMRSLRELLYNSAKYSDGKKVVVRITHTDQKVQFCVEDTGPGIPEDVIEKMFEPFTKVNDLSEGLGLGLPLSKHHALGLGGDLTLDTSYHEGCRFVLELPMNRSEGEKELRSNEKITEQPSRFDHLEQMSVGELLRHINEEDRGVAEAVGRAIPQIEALVTAIEKRMKQGGRLFYIGAGTSGRLGVLDASELPPTFGVSANRVMGIIAGGDKALRKAVERAEDIKEQGWKDLQAHEPTTNDTVLGIAASGTTPYVVGAIRQARQNGLLTGCITSNPNTPLAQAADYAIETIVGPEFVTGSSRMKSGTAQKMVLNMISTTLMIRLGRVQGNRMVKMQLTNAKLIDRGTRMVQEILGVDYDEARQRLLEAGSVEEACADHSLW